MTTQSEKEAKYFEGLLLWEYENRHWEIPPGNDKLEKKAVLATIEPDPKTSTENILKDFITQDKTNKEISAAFGVPEYIIENLKVYFLL